MARKRFVPIVAVLMLAGSALLALLGFYVVRDARVTLSKVTAQKVFITETLQTFQKQVAGRKIDKNQASSMIGQSATVPGKAADKKGDEYRPHRPDPMVALKASPQLFSMYMQQYRASLQVYYGVAFRVLGLTSDQISKFHDLMCEHEEKRPRVHHLRILRASGACFTSRASSEDAPESTSSPPATASSTAGSSCRALAASRSRRH